jgi:diacylglycerol kinase family enzyme
MGRQRWLARLSILLAAGAVAVLIGLAGLRSVGLVTIGALGACVTLAGGYLALARRGVVRLAALGLVVAGPVGVLVLYAMRDVLWVAVLAVVVATLAVIVGRAALGTVEAPQAPGHRAEPPGHAFLIMNPASGGGKVSRFGLKEKAESLGAEVAMLDGPALVDVAALARRAVADGADLLGVAGGDGTQALVAGIAAEHGLPFLCISAGTRNHFAMDLGLDRDDPSTCLDALTDGEEHRIDLGRVGDRTFVNNASFGVYAEVVRSPAYRDDKRGTTLDLLPDLLKNDGGHRLSAHVGGADIEGPQALLVSNNAYETTDLAGLGRRSRLDGGQLGVIAVMVDSVAEAISLVRRSRGRGLTMASAAEVIVEAGQPEIPVGIDGETVMMPTPVRCVIMPKALRVVVPRNRPGVPAPRPALSWSSLAHLAAPGGQASL